MDQDEALRVATQAIKNALDQARDDVSKAEEILQHHRIMNPSIDHAFTITGLTMLESQQAEKH